MNNLFNFHFIMQNLNESFLCRDKAHEREMNGGTNLFSYITILSKSLQLLERERDQNRFFVQIVLEESSSRCCFVLLMLTIAFLFPCCPWETATIYTYINVKMGFILLTGHVIFCTCHITNKWTLNWKGTFLFVKKSTWSWRNDEHNNYKDEDVSSNFGALHLGLTNIKYVNGISCHAIKRRCVHVRWGGSAHVHS